MNCSASRGNNHDWLLLVPSYMTRIDILFCDSYTLVIDEQTVPRLTINANLITYYYLITISNHIYNHTRQSITAAAAAAAENDAAADAASMDRLSCFLSISRSNPSPSGGLALTYTADIAIELQPNLYGLTPCTTAYLLY